ncbi:helix-turn-helix transcriptional regulator [Paenibacillus xylanexedens]|uniref:helix-turn-helix transcriptional regulator n=1 Tax=Paenibacillus xylanexedens TaxID=528191 RepID=UPI00119E22A8|nr:AraC family transcriptional regulator [Paenibacillus xylanexedens]
MELDLQAQIVMWERNDARITDMNRIILLPESRLFTRDCSTACFLYVIRGGAQIRLDGQFYATKPYMLLHVCKNVRVELIVTEPPFEFYLLHYGYVNHAGRVDQVETTEEQQPISDVCYACQPRHAIRLHHLLQDINELWDARTPINLLKLKALFFQFVYELLSQLNEQNFLLVPPDRVAQTVQYLDMNYMKPIRLDELADVAGYSTSHLSLLFKERTGLSLVEFLIRKRISSAKELLVSTGMTIKDVAEQVGYKDVYYFSRLFRKHAGDSPMQYRTLHQKKTHSWNNPSVAIESSIVPSSSSLYNDDIENHYHL